MFIRQANEKDLIGIQDLIQQVHDLHVENKPTYYKASNELFSMKDLEQVLGSDQEELLVAENQQGMLIGYVKSKILEVGENHPIMKPRKILYIEDLCVDKEHRGQGIGKALMEEIVAYGKEQKVNSIELMVWEFNEAAKEFYEKYGMSTRSRRLEMLL